jgi:hypothetical protein
MPRVDLRKLALRLKVIEMLRAHSARRRFDSAWEVWRQKVLPN